VLCDEDVIQIYKNKTKTQIKKEDKTDGEIKKPEKEKKKKK